MLQLTGNSPVHSGRAYTGIAEPFSGSFSPNPAGLAGEVSSSNTLYFGSLNGSYAYPSLIGVYPNQYFKSAFEYSFINYYDSQTIDTHSLSLAGARSFGSQYDVGVALNYRYLNRSAPVSWFSVSAGAIYHLDYNYELTRSLGVFDVNAGITLSPGFYIGDDAIDEYSSMTTWSMGYDFTFYRDRDVKLKWFHEVAVLYDYFQIPFKHGIEAEVFNQYTLRMGTIYPDAYGFGNITVGAGYTIKNDTFAGSIDYSLVHRKKDEFVHYAGVSFSFSSSIRRRKDIRLAPERYYFSPDGDSIHDDVTIRTQQYDNIKTWELRIKTRSGTPVKTITYETVNKGTVIDKVLSKESSFQLPSSFVWDGTDNNARVVPDGDYIAELHITTKNGDTITQRTPPITVDTQAARVDVSANRTLISPETDMCRITHTDILHEDSTTEWTAEIVDRSDDTAVVRRNWKSGELPEVFEWFARDDDGSLVKDGVYSYTLTSTDLAGNTYQARIDNIMVVTGLIHIDIHSDKQFYSASDPRAVFITDIPKKDMISKSKLYILSDDTVLETIEDPHRDSYPEYELDSLPDGTYTYFMKVSYETGDNPETEKKQFVVDTQKPDVSVEIIPTLWTQEDRALTAKTRVHDLSGIHHWEMRVTYDGMLISKKSGHGHIPDVVTLGVQNSADHPLQPYTAFTFLISLRDNAGNTSEEVYHLPEVDVPIQQGPVFLKIPLAETAVISNTALQKYIRTIRESFSADTGALTVELHSTDSVISDLITDSLYTAFDNREISIKERSAETGESGFILVYRTGTTRQQPAE